MMEDKDWLKGLQNKMKDYEEPAPEGLWEDIEFFGLPAEETPRGGIADPVAHGSRGRCCGSRCLRRTPSYRSR